MLIFALLGKKKFPNVIANISPSGWFNDLPAFSECYFATWATCKDVLVKRLSKNFKFQSFWKYSIKENPSTLHFLTT